MNTDTDKLADLLAVARRAGADEADAVYFAGTSLSVSRRLGQIEHVERSEGRDLGLRVFVGERSAIVSAPGLDPAKFADIAERAIAMARLVPADPLSGLLDIGPIPALDLDMADTAEPDAATLGLRAGLAEDAALSVAGITNSEGADASYSRSEAVLVTSRGFAGHYRRTGYSVSATALAGSGTDMQRDYDYTSAVHQSDLDDPVRIGLSAAERALARLNPTRPKTGKLTVIYDPRVSSSLIGHLAGAVNGAGIARGTSFLREKMGQQIFARGITIRDDPHRLRGLRSRPFDGEGQPTAPLDLIADGMLMTWVLDGRTAKQLGLKTTGNAARGTSGPPSPSTSNLYMAAGTVTPAALMADIKEGLYVTELIGSGINGITGDYSRGAAGFMIRDGVLAEPVAEITIADNLIEMFARLIPANDLRFLRGTDAPTIRIDGMTMAGA
ncbi:TldD/PmbA family protein [Acidisoma cellulosilytica]|uniref:TldD/PmbA family protein n=1 Tax=Acidisoma cellulosilyticum TaxID=2802395 RepID=A0A963YYP5_9PROT|nr:TldD/PmbA family protein [Acidisoma cellulosilyticum]MCB8879204.1 TldD/PmbA family protein [Acidisoma cellulosilyticum]